jgi:hypothetical protein
MNLVRRTLFSVCFVILINTLASARVDHIDISVRADLLSGKTFGSAGAYERIVGRVYFRVLPDDVHNRQIVDLAHAPRNQQGEVEFSADLFLLRPKDPVKGNGALLLEIPNRGSKSLLRIVDGGTSSSDYLSESELGDTWLLRQGYTFAVLGWQWDVADDAGLRLYAPIAHEGGQSITGLLRADFTLAEKKFDMPLGHFILGKIGGTEYSVASPDDPRNVLTVRDLPTAPRRTIPRSEWSFSHEVNGKPAASDRHIHLDSGFEPGKIYELVYTVRDPVVAGLGLAAVRDFVSWEKNDKSAVAPVQRAYAAGISQCGRFLRHFLYQGFNADEHDRRALDGVLAHVAGAGRGSFNHRFAQPSRDAQPMSAIFYPTDIFPFTDLPESDPASGETAGLLDAAIGAQVVPRIFFSNTSYEYWGRAASLIHTTPDGTQDATISESVRVYLFAGLQHFSGPFPPEYGEEDLKGQQKENPNPVRWFWRAMITNMNAWVRDGREPPASSYPRLADGSLVPLENLAFPIVPGVSVPKSRNLAWHLDFGPHWKKGIITNQPPVVGEMFPVLVPQVDSDGNDRAGVHLPELSVPVATYTGWNLRNPSIGAPDQRVSFLGSYIPLSKTIADRRRAGDPRPSIEERYKNREDYLSRYERAAKRLVEDRWFLSEDLPAIMDRAMKEWDEAMK